MSFRRDVIRYALLTVLAEAIWLAFGLVLIGGLGRTNLLIPWWFASTAIPAAFVTFLMLRSTRGDDGLIKAIVLGVTLGVGIGFVIAIPLNLLLYLGAGMVGAIGFNEEGAKLVAALVVSIGLAKTGRRGLFVGAAVGLSFAMWESAIYYFADFLAGTTDLAVVIPAVLNRSWLGIGLHPLLTAPVVAAVFSAIGRPSAFRFVRAGVVFVIMAALHSTYDWLVLGVLPTDAGPFLLPPGDWIAIGLQLALLAVFVILLRRTRGSHPVSDVEASDPAPAVTAV